MTVRNSLSDIITEAAQQTLWEADLAARAAFALVRLDNLDALAPLLTEADRFDAAYALWDDYIDGRRADERTEPLTTSQLREQASVFARASAYLGGKDTLGLAQDAWGTETFEVFTRDPDGRITGKVGFYPSATPITALVAITYAKLATATRRAAVEKLSRSVYVLHGEVIESLGGYADRPIKLHSVFAGAGANS